MRGKPQTSENMSHQVESLSTDTADVPQECKPGGTLHLELLTHLPIAISIQSYIDPGAGLKQLQDLFQDSDFIFDSLFTSECSDPTNADTTSEASFVTLSAQIPMVRVYNSDSAM